MTGWLDDLFTPLEPLPPPDPVPVIDTRQGERTIIYWPGGIPANGVALTEAAITTLQNQAIADGISHIHLVIDGSATANGLVTMSGTHNLFTSVRLRSLTGILLTHTTPNTALFRNCGTIIGEGLINVVRDFAATPSIAFLRCDMVGINKQILIENVRWNMAGSGGTGPFVNLRNGARRVEWRNCGLAYDSATVTTGRLIHVQSVAPSALDLAWVGEFAGRLAGSELLQTTSVGAATWDTMFYYGSPFGAFLSAAYLASQPWTAGEITLRDARTVQQVLQRETFVFDFVDSVYLQGKPAGNTVAGSVPPNMGFLAGSHGVLMFNDNTGNDPAFSVLLFAPPVARHVRVLAVVIGNGSPGDTGNAILEVSCGSGGAKATKSFPPPRIQHEAITLYEGPVSGINAPGSDGAGGVTMLAVGRAANAAGDTWPNSVFIKRLIIEWAQLVLV